MPTRFKQIGRKVRSGQRKALDDGAVERVVAVIRNWPCPPLTWKLLTESVARKEAGGWTRQALAGKSSIADAFRKKKDDFRRGIRRPAKDPAVVILSRQIEGLKAQVDELKATLSKYEERFLTMLRNAAVRGISPSDLEKSLPSIDRAGV